MNSEKKLDALKFKRQLQKNSWKNSGAANLHEYIEYANKIALKSLLKKKNKDIGS